MSICLCVGLSVCLSACLSVHPSIYPSVCPFVHPFVHTFHLFLCFSLPIFSLWFQFDWVYWTGDLPAHYVWNQTRTSQVLQTLHMDILFVHVYVCMYTIYTYLILMFLHSCMLSTHSVTWWRSISLERLFSHHLATTKESLSIGRCTIHNIAHHLWYTIWLTTTSLTQFVPTS